MDVVTVWVVPILSIKGLGLGVCTDGVFSVSLAVVMSIIIALNLDTNSSVWLPT